MTADTNVVELFSTADTVAETGRSRRVVDLGRGVVRLANDSRAYMYEHLRHGPEPEWFTEAADHPLEISGEQVIKIDARTQPIDRVAYIYAPWGDKLGKGFGRDLLLALATDDQLAHTALISIGNKSLRAKGADFYQANESAMTIRDQLRTADPSIQNVPEVALGASMGAIRAMLHATSANIHQAINMATPANTTLVNLGRFALRETCYIGNRLLTATSGERPQLTRQIVNALPRPRDLIPMTRQVMLMNQQPLSDIIGVPGSIPETTRLSTLIGCFDISSNDTQFLAYAFGHANGQLIAYAVPHLELTHVSGVANQIRRAILLGDQPLTNANKLILAGPAKARAASLQWLSDHGIQPPAQTPNSQRQDAS